MTPFHLMASEGAVPGDRGPPLLKTRTIEVDLGDDESRARAIDWWAELTEVGGEGMVVKPR